LKRKATCVYEKGKHGMRVCMYVVCVCV
jgi:hypothetical protein